MSDSHASWIKIETREDLIRKMLPHPEFSGGNLSNPGIESILNWLLLEGFLQKGDIIASGRYRITEDDRVEITTRKEIDEKMLTPFGQNEKIAHLSVENKGEKSHLRIKFNENIPAHSSDESETCSISSNNGKSISLLVEMHEKSIWLKHTLTRSEQQCRVLEKDLEETNRGIVALHEELDEKKKDLQEKRVRLNELITNIDQVYWLLSLEENQVLYVSPNAKDVLNVEAQQLMRDPNSLDELILHEEKQSFISLYSNQPETAKRDSQNIRIKDPREGVRWIREKVFPIPNPAGEKNYRIAGTMEDITKRKNTRDSLEQFIHSASHDLKAPIRQLNTYTNMLKEDMGNNDEDKILEDAKFIHKSSKRLKRLLTGLLRLSRIGRKQPKMEKMNPADAIKAALANLEEVIPDTVELNITEMPSFRADPILIEELYQNLILNAVQHSEKAPIKISCSANQIEDDVILSIQDNGPGVDNKYHKQIFKPFNALKQGSTGLGLTICQEIANRHGGFIWVESKEGQGAQFKIVFPDVV